MLGSLLVAVTKQPSAGSLAREGDGIIMGFLQRHQPALGKAGTDGGWKGQRVVSGEVRGEEINWK